MYNLHVVLHSLNISLHTHSFMGITHNIRYYSHMPRRLVTGSSGTFMYSPLHFLSTPDTLVHISEYFYCAKQCTGTYSGIHPLPSIRPLCLHLLEFSIYLRSITKHSHPLSPFSELIGTYLFLIHFLFISFSFHISLAFLFLLCFMFQIFVFLFQSFIFLFLNISEYLYAHVLVVAQ